MRFERGHDPRRGRRPQRVSHNDIRRMWATKSVDPEYTKCQLARELKMHVTYIRAVINGTYKINPTNTQPNRQTPMRPLEPKRQYRTQAPITDYSQPVATDSRNLIKKDPAKKKRGSGFMGGF